jgi:hypothetical protein
MICFQCRSDPPGSKGHLISVRSFPRLQHGTVRTCGARVVVRVPVQEARGLR